MAGEINYGILNQNLPENVANSFYQGRQNALAEDQALRANKLADIQLQNAQQEQADRNALRGLNATAPDYTQQVMRINPKLGMELSKMQMEQRAAKLNQAKTAIELMGSTATQIMANPTPEYARAALEKYSSDTGLDVSKTMAQLDNLQGNPEAIKQWAAGHALKAADLLPKFQQFDQGGAVVTGSVDPITGAFKQGQAFRKSMTPGEIATLNNPTLQHIETADGVFAFNPKTGKASPVISTTGAPLQSSKGLTEVQAKGVGFATRAAQASKIIENIGESGNIQPGVIKRTLEATPLIGEGLGTLANATQSAAQQQVEQAQRDFVNAILRQESGAAISPSEFENAKKQYFPQPGDKDNVIQQKAQNRANAVRALETQAGPGMRQVAKPEGPQIGDKVDGYVYIGGDPGNKKSWKVAK